MGKGSVISQIKGKIVKFLINIILLSRIKNSIYACIIIYELIQFLALIALYSNPDLINTPFFNFVSVFDILYFLTLFNQPLIPLIALVIILVLILSQLILAFFTLQNKKVKLIKLYNKFISYQIILFNIIGILPILHISSIVFICDEFSSELYSENCTTKPYLYKSISIISYVIICFLSLFFSYYLNDDTMRSNLPWSQPFSPVELIKVIQKLILPLILLLGQSYKIVICILIFLLGILIFYYRFLKTNFLYNKIFNGFSLVYESCIILA